MNKQYVAPKSTVYNYIQPLTPLCASKEFGVGSSSDPKGGYHIKHLVKWT